MEHWQDLINSDIVAEIKQKILTERQQYNIFPVDDDIFKAFDYATWENVKVVILGQDPYPTKNEAHGLSFSVNPDIALPKSLVNIYKELQDDLGVVRPNGCLIDWAEQGILLLNTTLTVREGERDSHSKIGWKQFTDKVIETLSTEKEHLVFLLWGNPAQTKLKLIDRSKHCVLTSVHPSPLSAHKGFFGSKPFSNTNTYLQQHNIPTINW